MGSAFSSEVFGSGTEGYHVLRVHDNSPGQTAGLQAYFDFIVAIGHTRLNQDNETLKTLLKSHLESPVTMMVYSSKMQSVRQVSIMPSEHWGGQGVLGVTIRFCSFEGANENVWHILEVQPGSPAEVAGLRSNTDYVIGADNGISQTEDLFGLIESQEGKALRLYVYNCDADTCREVTITPNGAWGGEGSLGCNIGYGYLHRIPKCSQFPSSTAASSAHPAAPTPTKVDGFSEVPLTAACSVVTEGTTDPSDLTVGSAPPPHLSPPGSAAAPDAGPLAEPDVGVAPTSSLADADAFTSPDPDSPAASPTTTPPPSLATFPPPPSQALNSMAHIVIDSDDWWRFYTLTQNFCLIEADSHSEVLARLVEAAHQGLEFLLCMYE
ncbi:hypothetical protein ACOMHN_005947 [Nucella lapillus]